MKWYVKVMKNYANFSGRAQRAEYWWFTLVNVLVFCVLVFIDALILKCRELGVLTTIYQLAIILPSLGVTVRRFHDVGKSGLWLFLGLIPFGVIYLFYLTLKASDPGANQYGDSPLQTQASSGYAPNTNVYIPENGGISGRQIRYCRKCGEKLASADSQFCSKCGTKVAYEETRLS